MNSIRGNLYRYNLLDDILEFFDVTSQKNFKSYWVCSSEEVTQKIVLSWHGVCAGFDEKDNEEVEVVGIESVLIK